jgi:hypothetical protein
MTNIPPIDAPSILPEAIEDDEMAAILRGFAERHEEFLREQERAPVCLRTSAKKSSTLRTGAHAPGAAWNDT